ncbi:MAG: kinesin [Corynebacterium sp.]|uniref:kinesin n=1 Tax=Corynebacterium sp. TaxID=1720 RepID=UPI00280BC781|nr:kinesin [Corynebacterium sp.]MDU3166274.1 kinesin [Corynebacterium sp.]MDU4632831.1 kinesin [Corynebacterium sp.]MDU6418734.1 kinesin [Corynebacterium sp.]MDU6592918.1 kinesin [Corynebacterium sp.]
MANELGHEVDLDRNEYKYLASEDSVSSAAKSDKSSGAATGVAAGAAAAGAAGAAGLSKPVGKPSADGDEPTASKYEPQNHVVAGAEEEHVGKAAEQPDLQEALDENNADYAPSQHIVGEAKEEHIGSAPQQPNIDLEASGETPTSVNDLDVDPEMSGDDRDEADDVTGEAGNERLDQLKGKASEAGSAVGDAFQRAKGFVEDKAHEYQEETTKKGGFFDRVKGAVRDARESIEDKRKN